MTREKEVVCKDHIILPPESVEITGPHFNPTIPLPNDHCVYLWASKIDPLPFYLGIGSEFQAYELVHRYESNQYTLHQMVRNIINTNFICILVKKDINKNHAYSLYHYLYHKLKASKDPTHKDILFTMKTPTWIPKLATEYSIVTPLPDIPSLTQQQLTLRKKQNRILYDRLLIQKKNERLYKEYKAKREVITKTDLPPAPTPQLPTVIPQPAEPKVRRINIQE